MAVRVRPLFECRRMTLADLDEVLLVEAGSFKHPWSAELFKRELEHDWSTILVAVEPGTNAPAAGRIVGFLIYWLVHDEIHVLNVATAPAERRRGIARFLMSETESRARAADCAMLTLEARRSNLGALALYRELGYEQVGVRKGYYADENEDAIVMTRQLRDRGF
jgi:[ribosomal protein S18]-alanine N-acetyltransferase